MMNRMLAVGVLVFALVDVLPVKANWVVDKNGNVTRTQILGDEVEKKEEKKAEEKKEEPKKEEEKKEEKKVEEKKPEVKKVEIKKEGNSLEMQKGPIQLKIEKEGDVLKVKGKDGTGKEFEMETKKNEKVEIKDEENPRDDFEIASGSGKAVRVKKGEVEAETELPVTLDTKTHKLSVNGKEIKFLPDDAVKNAFASSSAAAITKVEIKNRGQETVYEISREEKKKLFGFIDFTFNKSSVVSSNTGKVLESTQAWWSSLLENFSK